MKDLIAALRVSVVGLVVFTVLLGVVYPLVIGIVAKAVPHPAPTELVGQPFDEPGYFWSRLSAVSYNAMTSSGTNTGPTGFVDKKGTLGANPALVGAVTARIKALRDADPGNTAKVPVDLVTASSSGLDPDISPAAAYYQIGRVARARNVAEARVRTIVDGMIAERTIGVLGERRVNVVRLNRELDRELGALKH